MLFFSLTIYYIDWSDWDLSVAAASFNESTESIEQEQEQEPDSPTETDLSVVSDVHAEAEDGTVDDDDASLVAPKPVLDR